MSAMKDWQIAVMVVICVVFVALATLLIFLIYRFWNGTSGARRCGTCGDDGEENDEDGGHSRRNRGNRGVAFYPGCRPSPHILHFLDFNQRLCQVDLKKEKIKTGRELQLAVARVAGVTERVDTLSLAATYASSGNVGVGVGADDDNQSRNHRGETARLNVGAAYLVGEATLEVDLDLLVAQDAQRGKRMMQTAERPLLLHRLVEVSIGSNNYVNSENHRTTMTASSSLANPFNSDADRRQERHQDIDISLSRDQQQQQQQQQQIYRWSEDGLGTDGSRLWNDFNQRGVFNADPHANRAPSHLAGLFRNPTAPSPLPQPASVPTPLIFPSYTSHITTDTPVFIMAAHYFICFPEPITREPVRIEDDATTAMLEAAMCGETGSRIVSISHEDGGPFAQSTFIVNPAAGTASLRLSPDSPAFAQLRAAITKTEKNAKNTTTRAADVYARNSTTEYLVIRRKADVIGYCLGPTGSALWRCFDRPLRLPAGRWCLQAKASTEDGMYTDTAAKVFSVDVAIA